MTSGARIVIAGARGPLAMDNSTVSAGYTRALLGYAVSRGADRERLIAASGVELDLLADPDARVPLARCAALMGTAVTLCNDPAFALQFGEAVRTEDLSVVMQIAGAAETVGESRARMNRFARLIRDDGDDDDGGAAPDLLRLVRDRHGIWLALKDSVHLDTPHFVEAGFAWCVRETRRMVDAQHAGRPFLKAIHFTHAEPGYRAEYDRIFQAPLVFGSDRNALLVDEAFLSLSLPPSNPYVSRVLSGHAEALLKSLESAKTTRGRVESLLIPSLHAGGANIDAVAGKMGLSRQTLFRRLRTEGVTFETVLDELRHRLALHYLRDKRLPVSEAAYLVGFSEPAAFSRAFKRWTGSSPSAARASGAG